MKKQAERIKIVVGTNSLASTTQPAYSNHCQFWFRLGRQYPNIDFCYVNPPRMSIDRMRNLCAETALNIDAKYVLFLDDDVLIPQPFDALDKLIACDADIAAADVIIRGYPFNHMLFRTNKTKNGLDQIKKLPPTNRRGQVKVDAVGFSLALIKVDLLRKMIPPYFITGVSNTEDIYFCVRARQEFPKTTIKADTSIICGHILWPEIIDSFNKENYTKYHDAQFGKPKSDVEDAFRGKNYLAKIERLMENA